MADTSNIKAKKYNWRTGELTDISFLAAKHVDGYCYFNDDFYYRCKPNGIDVQIFDPLNKIWVPSNKIYLNTIDNVDVSMMNSLIISGGQALVNIGEEVADIVAGSGSVASNASVENAVQWMIKTCANGYNITYDETINSARVLNSSAYNCSTFVITAFWQAGFPINTAVNTGGMKSDFMAAGFQWIPTTGAVPASMCKRGDILLYHTEEPWWGHTQCYIGNNQDANAGGTHPAIETHKPYYIPPWNTPLAWHGILRYPN